jgi:hypothetical protein
MGRAKKHRSRGKDKKLYRKFQSGPANNAGFRPNGGTTNILCAASETKLNSKGSIPSDNPIHTDMCAAKNSEPQSPKTVFHCPSVRDFEKWREYDQRAIVGVEGFGERQEEWERLINQINKGLISFRDCIDIDINPNFCAAGRWIRTKKGPIAFVGVEDPYWGYCWILFDENSGKYYSKDEQGYFFMLGSTLEVVAKNVGPFIKGIFQRHPWVEVCLLQEY